MSTGSRLFGLLNTHEKINLDQIQELNLFMTILQHSWMFIY